MSETKIPVKPSKKVQNAWKTLAEYMEQNGVYYVRVERETAELRVETRGGGNELKRDVHVWDHEHTLLMHATGQKQPIKLKCTITEEA